MTELVLAIDAGTGSGRAALFDREGRCVSQAARPWRAHVVPELAPLGQEYDPQTVRDAVFACVREALHNYGAGAEVAAIAVTGQRIACAFLAEDGETLYLGPNGDVRAMMGADLSDLDPDALYRETGRFPPWIFAPARQRWLSAAAPQAAARLAHVLDMPGWVAAQLGAEAFTDATLAADLMMLDVRTGQPRAGCAQGPWPSVGTPGQRMGRLSGEAAAATGLPAGVQLALGAADTALAVAASGDGRTTLVAGSSAPLVRQVDSPMTDPAGRLWLDPHVTANRWLLEANLGEMGTCHAWTRSVICGLPDDDEGWAAYDALAATAAPGCRGASAHLGPRAMDLRDLNTGRPAGLLMPFGQTLSADPPGRPELLRSFLESCAFATRAGLAWLDAVAPEADEALTVTGGMSRSALLLQLLSDTLGRRVEAGPPDATIHGAAACAMVGAGWADGLEAGLDIVRQQPRRSFVPTRDAQTLEALEDAFDWWQDHEALLEQA